MKPLFSLLLAGALLVSTGSTLAQAPEEDDLPQAPDPKPLLGRLKLDDQQKKQIEQMRFDMQKQLIGVRAKLQTARLELRQLLAADKPDKAAIEQKMGEVSQIGLQTRTIRLNEWFEVNKILKPDQQKVWKEILKHPFRERARAWRGGRFEERGGSWMHRPMMEQRGGRSSGQHRMKEGQKPEAPQKPEE
jgi:Spy/CpxP family protein refolding chaperone